MGGRMSFFEFMMWVCGARIIVIIYNKIRGY